MHSSPRLETAREFAQGNEELSRHFVRSWKTRWPVARSASSSWRKLRGEAATLYHPGPAGSRGLHVEGMNGRERLRKTLFELSFAGFGGDGPGGQFLWCSCPNGSWVVLTCKVCWQVPWRLSSSSGTREFRCIRTCRSRVLR